MKELSAFGSPARGESRLESDIDPLVEFLPRSPVGLFELWVPGDGLESAFGTRIPGIEE
jgi:predicted nucleotidyltransferase